MNAVLQGLLSLDKSFNGRGPVSRLIHNISFSDQAVPPALLLPLVSQCGFPIDEDQAADEVWDTLCSHIASEDGSWLSLGGTLLTRIECLGCHHIQFSFHNSWLWQVPMERGDFPLSHGCNIAQTATVHQARNDDGAKEGFSCPICQPRSGIADLRSVSSTQESWSPSGTLLAIRANWRPSSAAITEAQISSHLMLQNKTYDLFAAICHVTDPDAHYVAIVRSGDTMWLLDDAARPVRAKGWCAHGAPDILLFRASPPHQTFVHAAAIPLQAPVPCATDAPTASENDIARDVNKLRFRDKAQIHLNAPVIRLRIPASADEWSSTLEKLETSLPTTLFHPNVDPRISSTMISDIIHDSIPTLLQEVRRKRPPRVPSHIREASNWKRRLRSLRRQSVVLGDSMSSLNVDFTDSLHLHSHFSSVARASDRFNMLPASMKRFHMNPAKFSREVLDGSTSKGSQQIKVSAAEAEEFFCSTYADSRNDPLLAPPLSTVVPLPPTIPFNQSPISLSELRRILKKKSNRCAPGPDGIPYAIYKRSDPLQRVLVQLFNDVIRTGHVPSSWGVANIVLIPKSSGIVDDVKELRPIALTNTMGKLFTAILARRLEVFLRSNHSWDISQKGFASGTQGCIDHSFTVQQALQDARSHHTNISVAWLDLKNAYGSISHKMVQYALRQYGVPLHWCQLVFAIYDPLCARVSTPAWSTSTFAYHKGVFQGDPLSPVIFNMVFSPIIAQIRKFNEDPYVTKCGSPVGLTAYADDLTIVTKTPKQLQRILDDLAPLLSWMRLSFNPKKCVGLVLQRGAVVSPSPQLFIGKTPFATITGSQTFKFLGVQIPASGNHKPVLENVRTIARGWWDAITKTNVSIPAKLEIFKFSLSRLRWHLTVYDWPMGEVEALQSIANSFLREWLHLPQSANLYVLHSPLALHVPLITSVFKSAQVSKHFNLQSNKDPVVAKLHAHRRIDGRAKWFVGSTMTAVQTLVESEDFTAMMLGSANHGHAGLGYKTSNTARLRSLSQRASKFVAEEECASRLEEVLALPSYVSLWSAIENDMVRDRHWQRAILGLPDKLLTFVLRAATNSLPTNRNLNLWRKLGSPNCPLCDKIQTLGHILNCCPLGLTQGRFTFRHDLVLGVFISAAAAANPDLAFHYSLDYVTSSKDYRFPFPVATRLRPDLIVSSKDGLNVWILELTVPLPHRSTISNALKGAKYKDLAAEVAATGRAVSLLPWEVTAFGNVTHSTRHALLQLGISSTQSRRISTNLAEAAIRGSFVIFQHRNLRDFPPQPLLDLLPPLPSSHLNPVVVGPEPFITPSIAFVPSSSGPLLPAGSGIEIVSPPLNYIPASPIEKLDVTAPPVAHFPSSSPVCSRAAPPIAPIPPSICPTCARSFSSARGLAVHQGRWCKGSRGA